MILVACVYAVLTVVVTVHGVNFVAKWRDIVAVVLHMLYVVLYLEC